jgi:hypothetical protein
MVTQQRAKDLLTSSHETQDAIEDRARQVDLEEPLPLLRTYRLVQANPIQAVWLGDRFLPPRRDSKGDEETHITARNAPPIQSSVVGMADWPTYVKIALVMPKINTTLIFSSL